MLSLRGGFDVGSITVWTTKGLVKVQESCYASVLEGDESEAEWRMEANEYTAQEGTGSHCGVPC